MELSVHQLNQIVNGQLKEATSLPSIKKVVTDSRQLIGADQTIFFALVGPHFDGHQFIASCYEQGVRCFVVQTQPEVTTFPEASFIVVDHTLHALQQLAAWRRQQFLGTVVGITGSNGKTIVKEWLWQLLFPKNNLLRSPGSYNSQVGVPLSVLQLEPGYELAIFEAGISRKGEMEKLEAIIQPTIGIFTNIGSAHDEGFSDRIEKVREKIRLFRQVKTLIYCKDYALIEEAVQASGISGFSWSENAETKPDIWLKAKKTVQKHTQLTLQCNGNTHHINIPFTDRASVENAMHCAAFLLLQGYPLDGFEELTAVEMRLEIKEGIQDCTIINDSYNNDLQSLQIALQTLQQRALPGKSVLVLSDLLQTGMEASALYQQTAELIAHYQVDQLIAVGPSIRQIQHFLSSKVQAFYFEHTAKLLQQLHQFDWRQHTILVKGARRFGLEQLASRLSKKIHLTVLEVRLQSLRHNLSQYRQLLHTNTKIMVMVKAAAYGSGAIEVARVLEKDRVDYLAVAYADEGIELREGGIELPIMVLNPEEAVIDAMIRYRLEPEIYSLTLLQQFAQASRYQDGAFPIHIKFDTGMHRLGFEATDLPLLLQNLKNNPQLKIHTCLSHLAASEAPEHDEFSLRQIRQFEAMYQQLISAIGYQPIRHMLNSSGISRFPKHQMDMVRLGIGLYGIEANPDMQPKLRTVLQLKASVSQVKHLPKGETVGYGRKGRAEEDKKIATISIGYADGLWRAAGNGKFSVSIRGQLAPTIGNVCMDMCMVDVSHIPDVQIGDAVLIFGPQLPVHRLADALHTIPYEILTSISGRVRRIYLQD